MQKIQHKPYWAKCWRHKARYDVMITEMMTIMVVMMLVMMMMVILNGIEITNSKADSMKVDFSDRVKASSNLKLPNLGPGVCRRTEEKYLQGKARHHIIRQRIPPQYLISVVTPIIASIGHHQTLVEGTSSGTIQCPGKNLLCPEQHFWKVQTSRCICTGIILMNLIMIVLQIDDGFNKYHKCGHDLYNSGNIIA